MITDKLSNASLYYGCHPKFKKAFEFLLGDINHLSIGKYVIDGDQVFALVQKCDISPEGSGTFEAHKKYIDIQYIVKSSESFQYAHKDTLTPKTDYEEIKDAQRFCGQGSTIALTEGDFIVFFPEDAHLACISPDGCVGTSEKIVIKVHV